MLQEEAGAEGGDAYNVSRLRSSSLEIREKGTEFLREQLDAAQKELKLKGEECERLSHVRDQLEQELEELTASLFEEAHKMVREANVKQAAAEKQLKEAQGKIDVLQAEVSALKTLVLTSTPSSPNRQLHPQLQSTGSKAASSRHTRHKSATLTLPQLQSEPTTEPTHTSREDKEHLLSSLWFCVLPSSLCECDLLATAERKFPLITSWTLYYLLSFCRGGRLRVWTDLLPSSVASTERTLGPASPSHALNCLSRFRVQWRITL